MLKTRQHLCIAFRQLSANVPAAAFVSSTRAVLDEYGVEADGVVKTAGQAGDWDLAIRQGCFFMRGGVRQIVACCAARG